MQTPLGAELLRHQVPHTEQLLVLLRTMRKRNLDNTESQRMTPEEMKAHNEGVMKMYQQIKPIIEDCDDCAVVFGTLLIILSACGNQLDMPTEHFKALVVQELDRLMLVDAKPEGLLS